MYNKIFAKILDSSIWLETNPTRIVWMTFLAAMDETGYAHFSALGNLAARARVTLEEANEAVNVLEAPDKESGDPANEGRRIQRVPGGWMVLNAEKYRVMVTRAVAQEKTRQRVAKWREGKRVTISNACVTVANGSKRSETPSEAVSEAGSVSPMHTNPSSAAPKDCDLVYAEYPRKVGKRAALKAIERAMKVKPAGDLMAATKAYATAVAKWSPHEQQFVPHPATWYNRGSYDDDPRVWERLDPHLAHQRPAPTDADHANGF